MSRIVRLHEFGGESSAVLDALNMNVQIGSQWPNRRIARKY